jgi:lysozyme
MQIDSKGIETIKRFGVIRSNPKLTLDDNHEMLVDDCERLSQQMEDYLKVNLSQGQFNALGSFAYNVGIGSFASSHLLSRLNGGNFACVPSELIRWNSNDGEVSESLTRRREAEVELWNASS